MKNIVLAVIVSTASFTCNSGQFWAVGCLDSLEQVQAPVGSTPTVVVVQSTGPATNVVVCSEQSPDDCYKLIVSPNGTWGSKWVTKP